MKSFRTDWLLILALFFSAARFISGAEPSADPVMGLYDGYWSARDGSKGRVTAQIRALGDGKYDGFILLQRAQSTLAAISLKSTPQNNERLPFTGTAIPSSGGDLLEAVESQCFIEAGKLRGNFSGGPGMGVFEGEKTSRKSPTLGEKAPEGALILFDGTDTSAWEKMPWEITPEGALQVKKGDIHARARLADFKLHVEFRTPFMPQARGQGRGNSGVYLQSKYEVQVLDSFGLYPLQNNDCSGLYQIQAPLQNACLPPLEWQTYDITFRSDGPTITVLHNGILVHDQVKIPERFLKGGTTGASAQNSFLKLQDHGNPVEYRNIWALPLTP